MSLTASDDSEGPDDMQNSIFERALSESSRNDDNMSNDSSSASERDLGAITVIYDT